MKNRGWQDYDFLVVSGDAYVDHPSFGPVVIARVLESEGFRVAFLAQPDWHNADAFRAMGRPRLAVLVSAGNLDSMVAHYTSSKKKRSEDFYSPGKKTGLRPDRATIVYANRAKEAFPGIPVIIGGLEASLRRFAHYDYWQDKVRRAILFDSKADMIVYGMGEYADVEIAKRLDKGIPVGRICDVKGTGFIADSPDKCHFESVTCPSYEEILKDKKAYAVANMIQYDEHDPVRGRAVIQACGDKYLIINPPQPPLKTEDFDRVCELPYTREPHPSYEKDGGVPAIEEVRFSVIHNRGCFGACNFCSLAYHQGRMITSRSHESVIREVTAMTKHPAFKGYVHDVGGPTANFRRPSCDKQLKYGLCKGKNCLTPTPCKNLVADHTDYLSLLRKLRQIPGVKKVFVRSGIRFDYLLEDKNGEFFSELVKYHISGQLKVAPEHCIDSVLDYMGKPHNEVYNRFMEKYVRMNKKYEKEQYLVPYLISSHPGSTLKHAIALAEYLNKSGRLPEQVQDFYPTPGTISTCMYYTGLDPRTMKPVYIPKSPHEKAMQRALLQWRRPEMKKLVLEALEKSGRKDLYGYGKNCLIRPDKEEKNGKSDRNRKPDKNNKQGNNKKTDKNIKKPGGSKSNKLTGHKKSSRSDYK